MKTLSYSGDLVKPYFWRSVTDLEIDYIELRGDEIYAYEFKWGKGHRARKPRSFLSLYPEAHFTVVDQENFVDFISGNM